MSKIDDVMVDLETMGTGSNAAVIAIGAVGFDKHNVQEDTGFYRIVDLASAMGGGGVVDAGTILWWLQQSDEARGQICRRDAVPLELALKDFYIWVFNNANDINTVKMWGNGSDFDNVILRNAYANAAKGHVVPWRYHNSRCYRTMKNVHAHIPPVDYGVKHNALHDAIAQARHLVTILNSSTGE